jgi:hypothetical protein
MAATMKVNIEQIKGLISQVSLREKEILAKYLDDLTLKNRFKRLIARNKNVPLSYEDITSEVEQVRAKRYKCGQ